jgi:predicted acetyltransferase
LHRYVTSQNSMKNIRRLTPSCRLVALRQKMLAEVPKDLVSADVTLAYEKTVAGDASKGLAPFYHFKILNSSHQAVGHINFRVGETRHVMFTAGHVGFGVLPEFRGHSFALKACRALIPLLRKHYRRVILTADPGNSHSIQIFEKLGAVFMDEVEVPAHDPAYVDGARKKVRYEWAL